MMELVVFAPYDEVGDCKQRRLPLALIIRFQNVITITITITITRHWLALNGLS